ncbi:MAG TPA: F0F1 ATP synthase subunit A [Candidatus Acidoferrum sp.]|jgi:F-type H+-transporting ATPase subunit a
MEEHVLGITRLVNQLFGPLALSLLHALHIAPGSEELPIPQHVVMAFLVVVIGTILALILRARLSVEKPGAMQQAAEFLLTNPLAFGINDILAENTGHEWKRYVPLVGSLGLFVLLGNLFGAFPFLAAPTSAYSVPLAAALIAFLYSNWQGVRHHGALGYLKTFSGGVDWWLTPLIFPVEIISTCARLLSLSVRLWANIFASDMIYGLFLGLFAAGFGSAWEKSPVFGVIVGVLPALIPLVFIGLHIFVSIIQAYVFTILPSVYIGLATAEEH